MPVQSRWTCADGGSINAISRLRSEQILVAEDHRKKWHRPWAARAQWVAAGTMDCGSDKARSSACTPTTSRRTPRVGNKGNKIEYHFRCLATILSQPVEAQPTRIEQLRSRDALTLLQCLMRVFPSIPWAMYDHQIKSVVESHTDDARQLLNVVKAIKTDDSSVEEMLSIGPGIRGSFHAAVKTYAKKRRADFTKGGVFDGSGHHMLGLVENFESRQKDVPLARLGFAECQEIYDFWRNRQEYRRSCGVKRGLFSFGGDVLTMPKPRGQCDMWGRKWS